MCDNVACDKGVCVCVCVCEKGFVAKMCAKTGVSKMCIEDVVCSRRCVTKMCVCARRCDKDVCERWCVTKVSCYLMRVATSRSSHIESTMCAAAHQRSKSCHLKVFPH